MKSRKLEADEIAFIKETTLLVRGLSIAANVGVYDHERLYQQTLLIDADVVINPVVGTALSDTWDYTLLQYEAERIATSGHIPLIETFSSLLGRALISHPKVKSVKLRVSKPAALKPSADLAAVEITIVKGSEA